MPIMDGYEAHKAIKANPSTSNIPIIALTASAIKEEVDEILKTFDGYLRKPITKQQLLNEIARFLQHTEEQQIVQESSSILNIQSDLFGKINSEMIADFNDNILPEFNIVKKSLYVSKIKQFANKLIKFGDKYQIEEAQTYGKEIIKQANTFRIDKIITLFNDFQQFINKINTLNIKQ